MPPHRGRAILADEVFPRRFVSCTACTRQSELVHVKRLEIALDVRCGRRVRKSDGRRSRGARLRTYRWSRASARPRWRRRAVQSCARGARERPSGRDSCAGALPTGSMPRPRVAEARVGVTARERRLGRSPLAGRTAFSRRMRPVVPDFHGGGHALKVLTPRGADAPPVSRIGCGGLPRL